MSRIPDFLLLDDHQASDSKSDDSKPVTETAESKSEKSLLSLMKDISTLSIKSIPPRGYNIKWDLVPIEVKSGVIRNYFHVKITPKSRTDIIDIPYYEIIEAVDDSDAMIIAIDFDSIGLLNFSDFKQDLLNEAYTIMGELFSQLKIINRKDKDVEFIFPNFLRYTPSGKRLMGVWGWDCDDSIFANKLSHEMAECIYLYPDKLKKVLNRINQRGLNVIITSRYHNYNPIEKFCVPNILDTLGGDFFNLIIYTDSRPKHYAGIYLAVVLMVPFPDICLVDDNKMQRGYFEAAGLPVIAVIPGSDAHLDDTQKRLDDRESASDLTERKSEASTVRRHSF